MRVTLCDRCGRKICPLDTITTVSICSYEFPDLNAPEAHGFGPAFGRRGDDMGMETKVFDLCRDCSKKIICLIKEGDDE